MWIDTQFHVYLMCASRLFIWIPPFLIAVYLSFKPSLRKYIPYVAIVGVLLHAYGFIIWAYFLGFDGLDYARSTLTMVTVLVYFAFAIPFRLSFIIVASYTVAFVITGLFITSELKAGGEFSSKDQALVMRYISTGVGTILLLTLCAYQTENIKINLLKSNNLIRHGRNSRQEWLRNMASFLEHELRGKRRAAETSLEMLLNKEPNNANVVKYGSRLDRSLRDMNKLIEQTVTAANLEDSLLNRDLEVVGLYEFLQNYCDYIEGEYNVNGIKFKSEFPGASPSVLIDKSKLNQMLSNIVLNAIDFREPNTDINVFLESDKEYAKIIIENKGPSLPVDDADHIFNMSYSNRESQYRNENNSGFGLFISRRIAISNRGSITAHNNNDGVCFEVRLPVHYNGNQLWSAPRAFDQVTY